MSGEVAIVDYGMGNIRSISNAFRTLGASPRVVESPSALGDARAIVVPGVGAFPDGMQTLRDGGFVGPLQDLVRDEGRPFLGVCLGMQLLAERSTEHGENEGLGWLPGTVERLHPAEGFQVPHMGWNELSVRGDETLFADLGESPTFYFVHSYHFVPSEGKREVVTSTANHGMDVNASVREDNVFGVQFHPEKSQAAGLKLLENFLAFIDERGGS